MASPPNTLYRNYDTTDTTTNSNYRADSVLPSIETLGWEREGYTFTEWNTSRDGTGTSYSVGEYGNPLGGGYYAIWQANTPTYSEYIASSSDLTSVANAIRTKAGLSVTLEFPADFVSAIANIPTGITPTGTKNISISAAGTTTEDVTNYANAEVVVPYGILGVPSASKGTVSNHSVSVRPSVSVTGGWINTQQVSGTSVTVSASELVSGTKSITISGAGTTTEDVTNYANVAVAVPSGTAGTPTATKGSVSNHSVSVTPSVTNSVGWVSSETKSGTPVSVTAAELVSGTLSITQNGTGIDVTNYAAVDVNISGNTDYLEEKLKGNLTSYENSNITAISNYGLAGATELVSLTLPNLTSVGTYGLYNCSGLTQIPNEHRLTSFGTYCFAGMSSLITTNLPGLTQMTGAMLRDCSNLETVVFPNLRIWYTSASSVFTNDSKLKTIDLGPSGYFGCQGVCGGCTALDTLILRKSDGIASLANINILNAASKFKSGGDGGTIYIPKALYDHLGDGTSLDYKAATNWSTIDGYGTITWAQIEGSQFENTYADGTHAVLNYLTPYVTDYRKGYVDNGTWKHEDPTNTLCDIYQVQAGYEYTIALGAVVGTRFRVMFTTTDVTQTNSNVSGTNITNQNNPAANASVTYMPSTDGYIIVAKDNAGTTGLDSFCSYLTYEV